MRLDRLGWTVALALAVATFGCNATSTGTPMPDAESRPEAVGRVVKVEPNEPIGYRLHLEDGLVLTVGPPETRVAISTTERADSLAIYGHDERGLWLVWLGLEPRLGPDCFALPRSGYDRAAFVGWPYEGFALPKAAGFRVESDVFLDRDPASRTYGWYTNGSVAAVSATFCISSKGEVTSVAR